MPTVAIIGSFRQHYASVLTAWDAFSAAGVEIVSPAGRPLLAGHEVRFEGDDPDASEAKLETLALERIMAADVVFVMAPDGYVGRATCYEIGRLVQAGRPLYFSERPDDLPLAVPDSHVLGADALATGVRDGMPLVPLHAVLDDPEAAALETRLVQGS